MYREVLMDLNDLEGDKSAGVWTLPVLLGKPLALLCAVGFLMAGAAASVHSLLGGWGSFFSQLIGVVQHGMSGGDRVFLLRAVVPLLVLVVAMVKLMRLAGDVWRSGFEPAVVGHAVDDCLKPIGLGMILMAAAAA